MAFILSLFVGIVFAVNFSLRFFCQIKFEYVENALNVIVVFMQKASFVNSVSAGAVCELIWFYCDYNHSFINDILTLIKLNFIFFSV